MTAAVRITPYFDSYSSTFSYVLDQGPGSACAIIDPVLDYDPKSGRTRTDSAEQLIRFVQDNQLQLQYILETHAHADHLSSAPWLRQQLGGQIVIGQPITTVQKTFRGIYNLKDLAADGSQFDLLLSEGQGLDLGSLRIEAMHVPGHTPADMAYHVITAADEADLVFVGDTLFAPDAGTARCDFPGGDAHQMFHSVRRLLS